VRTYGQYCPIARASELLGERWTIIILRNILVGCQTFNEIADGAPGLSRGLLSRRLRELEQAGVIEIRHKPDRPGSTYEPTPAGRELSEVMFALENWARKWVELKPEHAHPGVVLWVWANFFLDRDRLPRRRVLVRFEYPTLPGSARMSWMLIERGNAEYCLKYPGGEEELIVVVNDPLAFARWHMGQIEGVTPCAPGLSKSWELLHWPAPSDLEPPYLGGRRPACPIRRIDPASAPLRRPWPLPRDPRSTSRHVIRRLRLTLGLLLPSRRHHDRYPNS